MDITLIDRSHRRDFNGGVGSFSTARAAIHDVQPCEKVEANSITKQQRRSEDGTRQRVKDVQCGARGNSVHCTSRSGLRRAGGWTVVVVLVCWVCCVVTMMTVFFRTRLWEFNVYLCKKSLRKPKMIILCMDVYKVGVTVGGFGL